jgi:acetyl-CoA carboxylase carboxyl transferase subunit alpha
MANGTNELEFEKPIREIERKIEELETSTHEKDLAELAKLKETCANLKREVFSKLTPWERVQVARLGDRPQTSDYLGLVFTDWIELHGDRFFSDDRAILAGLGRLNGRRVAVIGHQKGKTVRERVRSFFGCAHPEGYRKALRVMKLAEKFHLPVVTLIDTPGAYPGVGAEERGQFSAIAANLMEMARLRTPIASVVIGEGGSGGALGIGVGDRLAILEHAYYSVISPEGCAAILWKNGESMDQAAEALRLTAKDLLECGVADDILTEPLGGAHRDAKAMADDIREILAKYLDELEKIPIDGLLEKRYRRFRNLGQFGERPTKAS